MYFIVLGDSQFLEDESTKNFARKVADHYSARTNQTLEEREASPIIHLKKLNNWVWLLIYWNTLWSYKHLMNLCCFDMFEFFISSNRLRVSSFSFMLAEGMLFLILLVARCYRAFISIKLSGSSFMLIFFLVLHPFFTRVVI